MTTFKVKEFGGDAISASLLPPEYQAYTSMGSIPSGCGRRGGIGYGFTSGVALSPGQLGGTVIDPTGAVVSNARVEVKSTSTGATWSASVTSDGSWMLLGLPSGNYQITACSPGFRSLSESISYDASHPRAYQLRLSVGSASETLEVRGSDLTVMQESGRKKDKAAALPPPPPTSANVFNLQQRVAGVLPVAVDIPRSGVSYRFLRPLVLNEETKLTFTYKSK